MKKALLYLVLLAAVAAAYKPAWHGGLLWDDEAHVTPARLQSASGLAKIWIDPSATQQYYPITNTAFWVMSDWWGSDTFGYHLLNIFLHACSAFLVVLILRRLEIAGAIVAGVVFALHPVHTESVAWISELKNTLSGFFYLSAFLVYLGFDTTRDRRRYVVALGLFLLALGSKTVTATLPVGLLVVFWWQRGRIDWRRDVLPLVPFVVLGLAAGLFTAWFEYHSVGAKGTEFSLTPVARILVAGRVVWFYLSKLVLPVNLSFNYGRWSVDPGIWWQYLFPVGLAAALAMLAMWSRKTRGPLAAALFFIVTLGPALGFVNVYPFRYSFVADHFQYLASLGVIAGICGWLAVALRQWRPVVSSTWLAIALGIPLAALTFARSQEYVSAETQYRVTIAKNPWSYLSRNNLAELLLAGPQTGWPEAVSHLQTVISFKPDDAIAHNLLGLFNGRIGRHDDAIPEFRLAIRSKPDLADAHYNLGLSLFGTGRFEEAVEAYETALRLDPGSPAVHNNLAIALRRDKRGAEALSRLRSAVDKFPDSRELRFTFADTLVESGAADEAIRVYREGLNRWPDSGEAWNNLGEALRRAGRQTEAFEALQQSARLLPASALVHANLATLLISMNRLEEALKPLEVAIQTSPRERQATLHNAAGVLLLRLNRSDEAAPHFEEALRIQPAYEEARQNLIKARSKSPTLR